MRKYLPWALLPLVACTEHRPLSYPDAGALIPGRAVVQTSFTSLFPAQWPIDLLFVIDNSASMAAKRGLLLQSLSKMMQALEKLDGGLPDLRLGVISTDLGAGQGAVGGDCGAGLGDQGLLWGHDPSPGALATVAGPPGNGCGLMKGVRWIEHRICPDGSKHYRNYEGELADVLSCMGGALGTHGCGYSHALQSLRLALNPIEGINEANKGFLRRRASLVIIIISDKDDCSADPSSENNDGMFSAWNPGDSPTLRCAARGHVCNGQAIPNYDPSTGYDGTQGPWSAGFESCTAKAPHDSRDPHWLPLISVQDAIDSVRGAKEYADRISVAGIIGWPASPVRAQAEYRVEQVAETGQWDLSPVCSAASVEGDGGKVYPAYRLKQFVDAFSRHDEVFSFSMCRDTNWVDAVTVVGDSMCCRDGRPSCVSYPLTDVDPNTPGVQPGCQVSLSIPGDDSGKCGGQAAHEELVPECLDPASGLPVDPDNPRLQLDTIPEARRPCWYLVHDPNVVTGCPNTFENQKLALLFKTGQFPPQGGMWTASCQTSPTPPVDGKRVE
jgi:hypothetical protein